MENVNSAYRLHEILQNANRQNKTSSTLDIWTTVFGVDVSNPHRKVADVSSSLALLHSELELLRTTMGATDYSANLYEPYLRKVESAISGQSLTTQWSNFKQYLSPDVLLSLRFCSEILPNEEQPISEEEWSSLVQEIEQLEEQLSNSSLPEPIKELILRHLSLIRKALGEYGIVGIKAVKEAVHKAAGELIEYKEVIKEYKDAPEVSKFGQIWQRTTQIADGVIKSERVIAAGEKIWALIKPIFDSTTGN